MTVDGAFPPAVTPNSGKHATKEQLPKQLYTTIDKFALESGEVLTNVTVAFTVKGRLNAQRTNAVVICHALSGRGSMGGMVALEWAILGKHFVRSMVLVATAGRQSPWAIAWAENQRATIKSDSKFRGGCYGDDPPRDGLAAARMAAMISYRTHSSFEKRFGRKRLETYAAPNVMLPKANGTRPPFAIDVQRAKRDDGHYDKSGIFLAQSYLRYQGEKFNARFDANCYLHILDKIDSHDIARDRYLNLSDDEAMRKVLGQIQQRTLVVGVPTDGLYPLPEQIAVFQGLSNATFATIQSDDGHDGFLLEGEQLNELLRSFFGSDPDLKT
ncbi:homoserine o-acetyltransferase [Fusarium heterosporum]|uniref:Homoserine o-acetyltransferase n=1 Tax=Fusarium heterosporum TaxID=42747 RepID=A0A8H5T237_FUSHE|nr:homoserine o-acetyltransferase [Fusarium heterosporum]